MSRRLVYALLTIVGTIVPYVFFVRYFAANGSAGFTSALFANGAAGGFSADVLISSLVFWVYLGHETRRTGVPRPWLYVALNLAIGLSCALPAFLWARERALARGRLSAGAEALSRSA